MCPREGLFRGTAPQFGPSCPARHCPSVRNAPSVLRRSPCHAPCRDTAGLFAVICSAAMTARRVTAATDSRVFGAGGIGLVSAISPLCPNTFSGLDAGSISTACISSQAQPCTSHGRPALLEQKAHLPLLVRLVPSVNYWEARHDTYPPCLILRVRGVSLCVRHAAVTRL